MPVVDRRFLVALTVLVVNDRWGKVHIGNAITGKVSDVVGPVVSVVLLAAVLDAVSGRRLMAERAAMVSVGVWFAAMNLSVAVGEATMVLANAVTPWTNVIVTDPFDVFGLAALPIASVMLRRPIPLVAWPTARPIVFGVGCLICLASSSDGPINHDVRIVDDVGVVATGQAGSHVLDAQRAVWEPVDLGAGAPLAVPPRYSATSEPGCVADEPRHCVRTVDGRRVEETTDGGASWREIWSYQPDALPGFERAGSDSRLGPAVIGPDTEVVFALLSHERVGEVDDPPTNVVARWPNGDWTIEDRELRPLPLYPLVAQTMVAVILLIAAWFGTSRRRDQSLLGGASLLTILWIYTGPVHVFFRRPLGYLAITALTVVLFADMVVEVRRIAPIRFDVKPAVRRAATGASALVALAALALVAVPGPTSVPSWSPAVAGWLVIAGLVAVVVTRLGLVLRDARSVGQLPLLLVGLAVAAVVPWIVFVAWQEWNPLPFALVGLAAVTATVAGLWVTGCAGRRGSLAR